MSRGRWSAEELVEAFALASIVDFLHRHAILGELDEGPDAIALRRGFDRGRLALLLEYVVRRVDLPGDSEALGHLLDKVAGAFGENLRRPELALRAGAGAARRAVNRQRHADAFSKIAPRPSSVLQELVTAIGAESLLELGCGPATELIAAAKASSRLIATGVDTNPQLLAVARQRAKEAGVGARVRLRRGDAARLARIVPPAERDRVQLLLASSLLNELFDPPAAAPRFLRSLARLFPGRLLLVRDYYGTLGSRRRGHPSALLHDVVQLLSGQGVPPSSYAGWAGVYAAAGCRVVQRIEGEGAIRWFVHVVELPYHRPG